MGIELPRELAEVAAATGLSWPQADEDKLREQAKAWRDAQSRLSSLAADADRTAGDAVGALSGTAAEAAGRQWSGFVDPDHGRLTTAARGAGEAADRLDHAAEQVGAAKVEMVRQLVGAAKDADAAHAAASAGHPTALLGLDSVLKGTATNLSAVTDGLANALGPGGGASAPGPVVDPHPGAHTSAGQQGLLSAVTGLPGHVLSAGDAVATPLVDRVGDTVDKAPLAGNVVSDTVAPIADHAAGAVEHTGSAVGHAGSALDHTGSTAGHAVDDLAGATVEHAGSAIGHTGSAAGHAVDDLTGSTMDTPRQLPQLLPTSTAPLPTGGAGQFPHPQDPPMPAPSHGGFVHSSGFADAPTPPAGVPQAHPAAPYYPGGTVASGFTDAAFSPPPAAGPGFGPGAAAPVPPPVPQPGYQPPFVGGVGPVGGAAAPPPPVAGVAPPAAPAAGLAPGAGAAGRAPAPGAGTALGAGAVPVPGAGRAPAPGGGFRYPQQPAPPYPQQPAEAPNPAPPMGTPRQERESIVALFLVHMFPIGHLPVASDRPQRQLPVPSLEVDYAPGLRFPPHDHPSSDLIDSSDALAKVQAGLRRLPTPPVSPPAGLTEGCEPLAGLSERDWNRRFLAGFRDSIPEYAWPPGEVYPEGGMEPGEPQVLAEGTMLDRFGDITGRVFAPEGTGFAYRSLPPSALGAGYRRYRVLREVPMWQARSVGWFGQPGGGLRYRAVYSADELVTMGYLADATFEETA